VRTSSGPPRIRARYQVIPGGLRLIYEDAGTGLSANGQQNLFVEDLLKSEEFCMKFVHDILDFSGMEIQAAVGSGGGSRFVIGIPFDRYRLSPT